MKKIELIENFDFNEKIEKEKEAREIFRGARRRLLEIKLGKGAVLSKHRAAEPITVLCLSGKGVFRAGENLEEEQALQAGTLITLESNIEHEVVAQPEIHILVTRFLEE